MPTYNRAGIIERAIKSVLSQTYNDFELIVIDDGSSDNTKEVLEGIEDKRIRTHFLKENKRVSAVRNIGVNLAQGDLIAYLDTDNLWYPNYLEVTVSEFSDDYVLIFSGQNTFLVSGDKTNPQIIGRSIRNAGYNPVTLIKGTGTNPDINCVIHTKQIIEEIGMFDENLSTCEDWDLFSRIAVKYPFKIKYVSQVVGEYYYYLKGTLDTISNRYISDEMLRDWFNVRIPRGDDQYIQNKIQKLLRENKILKVKN